MKNIFDNLNKFVVYAIYLLIFITLINGCNSCNEHKSNEKLIKKVDSLNIVIVNLNGQLYSKKELDTRLEILGYEISERNVYTENSIVRTIVRPDDVMQNYDNKIKDLQDKLKNNK